jgi:hypothetical protein
MGLSASGASCGARRSLPPVEGRGRLCSKGRGRLPVVWLHTSAKSTWALLHTIRRHGGRAEAVITLLVDVPRAWLRKSRAGLWYSVRDILPDRIGRVLRFAELAGASAT